MSGPPDDRVLNIGKLPSRENMCFLKEVKFDLFYFLGRAGKITGAVRLVAIKICWTISDFEEM